MKVYKSAVDIWLASVLIGTPLVVVCVGVFLIRESLTGFLMMTSLGLLTGVLIALFTIPCKYTVSEEFLEIRCGLMKERIDLEKIKELSLSSNVLSAPALSLKRIRIDLDKGFRLISPKAREEFISNIESLKRAGGQPVAGGDATR